MLNLCVGFGIFLLARSQPVFIFHIKVVCVCGWVCGNLHETCAGVHESSNVESVHFHFGVGRPLISSTAVGYAFLNVRFYQFVASELLT